MDIKIYIRLLLRWFWIIVLSSMLFGVLAYVVSQRVAPTYSASSVFAVSVRNQFAEFNEQVRITDTYTQLARSRPILEAVIEVLDLDQSVSSLSEQVRANANSETLLVVVTVEHNERLMSAQIANTIVEELGRSGRSLLATDRVGSRSTVQFIEVAQPPGGPASPQPVRSGILGVIMGGMLAVGILGLREYLDMVVRSADQAETASGLPILAALPRERRLNPRAPRIASLNAPLSHSAEIYRLLHARITMAAEQQPVRLLLVTGLESNIGTSLIVGNLAITLAQAGQRVIIVDANLRQPTIHKLFQVPATRGVTDILTDIVNGSPTQEVALEPYVRATGIEGLQVLPSGDPPANPGALLSGSATQKLLAALQEHADIVLFDTPPMLSAVDATLLMQACDATLLVAAFNHTRLEAVKRARIQLRSFSARSLGIVLTNTPGGLASLHKSGYAVEGAAKRQAPTSTVDMTRQPQPPATNKVTLDRILARIMTFGKSKG